MLFVMSIKRICIFIVVHAGYARTVQIGRVLESGGVAEFMAC